MKKRIIRPEPPQANLQRFNQAAQQPVVVDEALTFDDQENDASPVQDKELSELLLAPATPLMNPKGGFDHVPISTLQKSKFQIRDTTADNEYIESLMISIQDTKGAISPIVVRPVDKGYAIIAGHHRLEAYRRLGYSVVPVSIRHLTEEEAAKALAADNTVRKDLNDFDRYRHARMLLDNGFCRSNADCGRVLGIDRTLVTRLLSFDVFPDEAREILKTNPGILGAAQAYELKEVALEQPKLLVEAISNLATGKINQTALGSWIQKQGETSSLRLPNRRSITISHPDLKKPVKISFTEKEVKISADGLDIERLEELIQQNLGSLLKK